MPVTNCSGFWTLDGMDLWTQWKTVVLSGLENFLKYAPKKDSLEYDWNDQHGIDVDLSTPFFQARTVTLRMGVFCDTAAEFVTNHDALIGQLMGTGTHSFAVASHQNRVYSIEYISTDNYKTEKPLRGTTRSNVHSFMLTVREPNPAASLAGLGARIIDEQGRFIIT